MKIFKGKSIAVMLSVIIITVFTIQLVGYSQQKDTLGLVNPIPMNEESIQRGKEVFLQYCVGCHGRRADGRGIQALNLVPKPQNLRNAQFIKYLSDERIYTSISGGVRGTAMPAFEGIMVIPKKDRWSVINYIRSLTAGDTINLPNSVAFQEVSATAKNPFSPKDAELVKSGEQLYHNYCANCHGLNAGGDGVLAPNLTPAPRNLVVITSWGEKPFIDYMSDARLYDSITNGVPGTSMLPWIKVLDDNQRWQIINYLRAASVLQIQKIEGNLN